MDPIFTTSRTAAAIPIWFVTAANYPEVRERLGAGVRAFADAAGFEPKPGQYLALPGEGGLGGILFGIEAADDAKDLFLPGRLSQLLPDGVYRFASDPHDARLAALAFALGTYRFTRYRKAEARKVKLDLPQSVDREDIERIVEAVTLTRDLVNTPANDMGPAELEEAVRTLAARHRRGSQRGRRRRSAQREFSAHSRGRARLRSRPSADRHEMGRDRSSARNVGR